MSNGAAPSNANRQGRDNFLLVQFCAFYQEVANIKLAIREGRLPAYLSPDQAPGQVNGELVAVMASHRLKNILQQQAKAIRETGTVAEIDAYGSAQYVMAALADEIFILDVEWGGSSVWAEDCLEESLFGSTISGREFFVRLDTLLKAPKLDPLNDAMATLFLMALELGFKGAHRGRTGEKVLLAYREKLLQFIGPGGGDGGLPNLFPQAYQHRISNDEGDRLAPLSRWYMAMAAVVAIYLAASQSVWQVETGRLTKVTARAEQAPVTTTNNGSSGCVEGRNEGACK